MEKDWGGGVNIEKLQKGNYLEGRGIEPRKMLGENATFHCICNCFSIASLFNSYLWCQPWWRQHFVESPVQVKSRTKYFRRLKYLEWSKKKVKILGIKSYKASIHSTNVFSKRDALQQIIALMCVFSLMKNFLHVCHQAHLPRRRDCPSVDQVTYLYYILQVSSIGL